MRSFDRTGGWVGESRIRAPNQHGQMNHAKHRIMTDGNSSEKGGSERDAFPAEAVVRAFYQKILGREADTEGLRVHTRRLMEEGDVGKVLGVFLQCAEFRGRCIEVLAPEVVEAGYRALLRRDADAGGLATHGEQLKKNHDIFAFLMGMVESPEFRDRFRKRLDGEQPVAGGYRVRDMEAGEEAPAIVFTHHKCASTWLLQILKRYCATYNKRLYFTELTAAPPPPGEKFDAVLFLNSDYDVSAQCYQPWLDSGSRPALHVIRNPLDIVVSAYYSHLSSHPTEGWPELIRQREVLRGLDKAAGMLATWVFLERIDFDTGVAGPLHAMRRWKYDDVRIRTVRMEDLVGNAEFARAEMQAVLGEDVGGIISELTFERLSGGRPPGIKDDRSHYRVGLPHQWADEMEGSLARAIYQKYKRIFDAYYPEVEALLR